MAAISPPVSAIISGRTLAYHVDYELFYGVTVGVFIRQTSVVKVNAVNEGFGGGE